MRYRSRLPIALPLVVAVWLAVHFLDSLSSSLDVPAVVTARLASSSSYGPTAVVLGEFSASIQGPSSALWSLSIALIIIGALVVQYRYRNY